MESAALKGDLARAEAECKAFADDLSGQARRDGAVRFRVDEMFAALKRYEAVEDLLGRLMSYAGLVYAGDTTDPVRAKFYGDVQERLTAASSELLFFGLEMNRIDDTVLDTALARDPLPITGPGSRTCARTSPTSSTTRSSSSSTRSRSRAGVPGTGFSTRPSRRCGSTCGARNSPSSRP